PSSRCTTSKPTPTQDENGSVMHIGWVPDESGGYRGQMAVLVKPNGLLGAAYMTAIKPFRRLFVYPALLRSIERDWRAHV
ncbi:DUF2867 domain-containing protein, partial [Micromonospora andamanensis]